MTQSTVSATTPTAPPAFGVYDIALLGVMVIWGGNYAVVKTALTAFHPLVFAALRFAIAAIAMGGWGLRQGVSWRLSLRDWVQLGLLALVGNIIYQPLFVLGIARTTAGNAALILASSPLWVAVLSHFLRMEWLTRKAWLGAAVSFGGLLLVIVGGPREIAFTPETLLGNALLLLAVLCWATYTVMTRPLVSRLPALTVSTGALFIATPALVLIALPDLMTQDWASVPLGAWLGVLASGLLAIGFSYAMWSKCVQVLGGPRTAMYTNLSPIIAVIIGMVLLHEPFTWLQGAGAVGVLGGLALMRMN